MKLFVGLALLAVLIVGAILWFQRSKKSDRVALIALVKSAALQPGRYALEKAQLVPSETGRVIVISANPDLMVQLDEGGGHLGARGFVYVENTAVTKSDLSRTFGEGLNFSQVDPNWWRYKE